MALCYDIQYFEYQFEHTVSEEYKMKEEIIPSWNLSIFSHLLLFQLS